MKATLIRISNELLLGKKQDTITQYLAKKFLECGVVLSNIHTIQNSPDSITEAIASCKDNFIFLIGENSSVKNFNIKKSLSNIVKDEIIKSDQAFNVVNEYYKNANIPVLFENENEFYLPSSAHLLASSCGPLLGYYMNKEEKTYIFLPDEINTVKDIYKNFIEELIQKNTKINYKTITIKTFGICEKDIYSILGDLIKNKYKILFITYPKDLEVTLLVRYNETLSPDILQNFIVKIYEKLNKYIYADSDISLVGQVYELLKLSKKRIAIAESVTGGNIVSTLVKNCEGISEFLIEGIVSYSNESKMKRLQVNSQVLQKYSAISIETAYEMAAGLIETSNADIVVCTTGNSVLNENSGLKTSYIAVGDEDGIHVYKNSFLGNREEVIDRITQTAFFYLIKNIKQNDLFFNQITI